MSLWSQLKKNKELNYYLRDLYIFVFCIFVAIALAETIIFNDKSNADFTDRIIGYGFFVIPFLILALIVLSIYRNFRIRKTGKARSSIRYRLTIGFIFVSILPAIPVVILSSNVIGKLVESFYRIDVSAALRHSRNFVAYTESEDRKHIYQKARLLHSYLGNRDPSPEFIQKNLNDLGISDADTYYAAYFSRNVLIAEVPYIGKVFPENFTKKDDEIFSSFNLYRKDKAYIIFRINLHREGNFILLGKKIHAGMEDAIFDILNTENSYNVADLWKEKVPFSLRLTLGIFFIAIFAISIAVSFLFARQISRPIVLLADAVRLVSKGETDVILENREEGEMGILIESFNQMTMDLKSKTEELYTIQRVAAWKEVAQRMAHEIKNPLTPIQLSAERIRRNLENPNREKFSEIVRSGTDTIIGQVRVLEHLVKEFSEFARMPSPVLINQNIEPIMEESVQLFRDSHPEIEFRLKVSKNLPEVFIDKRLFLGAVNNLIKNAVEAVMTQKKEETAEEKKTDVISVSASVERKFIRKHVIISVEDSGPGIPEKMREKIFEAYFSTKEGHGSGIGLTIVQKTILDHHGHIYVESSKLGGCCFKIELPCQE
ncbi:MAG TPA: ATP-binding protein [Leptospiraceae bacterium]|nr:ATP-binding protein [Leptospiraceae bacterium]HNF13862.1 ATP-binding protein [Leptospiraceae bacterium]HNM01900.1 ATP-binding protein [Leptospiraceae bacterium]HNN03886.1 ATP-binding protein [Leptospiraceae bacterium]